MVYTLVPFAFFEVGRYKIVQDLSGNGGCQVLFYRASLLYRHGMVFCCNQEYDTVVFVFLPDAPFLAEHGRQEVDIFAFGGGDDDDFDLC